MVREESLHFACRMTKVGLQAKFEYVLFGVFPQQISYAEAPQCYVISTVHAKM
jgi:hypothetical protein